MPNSGQKMTTTAVNQAILDLYENEVRRVIGQVVNVVSTKFDLDKHKVEAAITDTLDFELTMAPPSENFVFKRRERKPKKEKEIKPQCCEITSRKTQCSRRVATMNDMYCYMHLLKH